MGHVLLIYLLSLTFSVVSPLVLPFSVIWFVFAWVQWRHNLCYVYQRKYESGGLMWTYMFSRICICLVIMQLFTFCVFLVKGAYVQAFVIGAFLPVLTIQFHSSCQRRFGRAIENVPLELASRAPRAHVPPLVYIPPPLQARTAGGRARPAARAGALGGKGLADWLAGRLEVGRAIPAPHLQPPPLPLIPHPSAAPHPAAQEKSWGWYPGGLGGGFRC
jgi:hypothetical protein